MKRTRLSFGSTIGMALTFAGALVSVASPTFVQIPAMAISVSQGRNEIYGSVFGDGRRPLADVFVELLDDFNAPLRHTKTDGTGRFNFGGLVNGRYVVKALPYGTDYVEQEQEVILSSVSATAGSGSDTQHITFYLKLNERISAGPFAAGPGVVFAQTVPPAAQKLFDEGVRYLHDKKEREGFESLKKSIEIFPDYYLALDRLGTEYAMRGLRNAAYLNAAFALLTHAVEVNPRGFSSVFGLGWSQYHLGLNTEAIESLKRATNLYDKSGAAHLWLGKALRRANSLTEAEAALKRADKLANGKSSEVHWQLAELFNGLKRYAEAANELESYLKTFPANASDAEKIRKLIKQLREQAAKS